MKEIIIIGKEIQGKIHIEEEILIQKVIQEENILLNIHLHILLIHLIPHIQIEIHHQNLILLIQKVHLIHQIQQKKKKSIINIK
jgi:hypothetical protein